MSYPRLCADIGGTNARFAICAAADAQPEQIQTLICSDYDSIETAIAHYLKQTDASIDSACLAVACSIDDGVLAMTNNHWRLDRAALKSRFALRSVRLVNDFESIALALPHLTGNDLVQIGGGTAKAGEPLTVLGPGTGLGSAQLHFNNGLYTAQSSEGGHVGIAPASARELAVFGFCLEQGEVINRELLLSGPGLKRLYQALCAIDDHRAEAFDAPQIQALAVAGDDEYCAQALAMFCGLLGSAAGDQALATGARGGVYLAGGILPRFKDYLIASGFRQRFEAKGKMRPYVTAIPTLLITDTRCGLLGAARAVV